MKTLHVSIFTLALAALSPVSNAVAPSPYAGEESRNIKALSTEEIQGYEAGKGMGFAKSAELNGYVERVLEEHPARIRGVLAGLSGTEQGDLQALLARLNTHIEGILK